MICTTYNELKKPLPLWNPKGIYYSTISFLMKTVGRTSNGIDVGYRYGFDSGVMLEYVYRNKSSGRFGIGKLIDRVYLNAPGWVGIRNRGELVTQTIRDAVEALYVEQGNPVKIVDLACGGGRYVLEALGALPHIETDVILRDYRKENVQSAQNLAKELGLNVKVEQADAFSDFDLQSLEDFQPDLVIVSGLHEIIEDDYLVQNHFRQIAALLEPGGKMVFTIQPDHPQHEFIARVLPSHTRNLWVMRLREFELTQSWARTADLRIENHAMEAQNIFGVVTATKD